GHRRRNQWHRTRPSAVHRTDESASPHERAPAHAADDDNRGPADRRWTVRRRPDGAGAGATAVGRPDDGARARDRVGGAADGARDDRSGVRQRRDLKKATAERPETAEPGPYTGL